MLQKIKEVPLHPKKVLFFCGNLASNSKDTTWHGKPCDGKAVFHVVSDDHLEVGKVCATCAERMISSGQLPGWYTAPIYHDDPNFADRVKPRS